MSSSFCSDQSTVPSLESLPQAAQTTAKKQSYGQILKSSALIGGSSVLNIAIRIVRTKAMAVLLCPARVGLFWIFWKIADTTLSLSGSGSKRNGVSPLAQGVRLDRPDPSAQHNLRFARTAT